MDMKNKPYIVINDEHDDEPTDDEIRLDSAVDMEYNNPYETYGEENFMDVGEIIETGGIFDGR